jgi:hypothetical protein
MAGLSVPHNMRATLKEACADMSPHPVITREIIKDLLAACKDRRIYASSRLCVVVTRMEIMISEAGVLCPTHQLGPFKTIGCSLGDGGVWLSISAPTSEFWLEIHVPMLTNRQLQGGKA